jgi:hypothetical protein
MATKSEEMKAKIQAYRKKREQEVTATEQKSQDTTSTPPNDVPPPVAPGSESSNVLSNVPTKQVNDSFLVPNDSATVSAVEPGVETESVDREEAEKARKRLLIRERVRKRVAGKESESSVEQAVGKESNLDGSLSPLKSRTAAADLDHQRESPSIGEAATNKGQVTPEKSLDEQPTKVERGISDAGRTVPSSISNGPDPAPVETTETTTAVSGSVTAEMHRLRQDVQQREELHLLRLKEEEEARLLEEQHRREDEERKQKQRQQDDEERKLKQLQQQQQKEEAQKQKQRQQDEEEARRQKQLQQEEEARKQKQLQQEEEERKQKQLLQEEEERKQKQLLQQQEDETARKERLQQEEEARKQKQLQQEEEERKQKQLLQQQEDETARMQRQQQDEEARKQKEREDVVVANARRLQLKKEAEEYATQLKNAALEHENVMEANRQAAAQLERMQQSVAAEEERLQALQVAAESAAAQVQEFGQDIARKEEIRRHIEDDIAAKNERLRLVVENSASPFQTVMDTESSEATAVEMPSLPVSSAVTPTPTSTLTLTPVHPSPAVWERRDTLRSEIRKKALGRLSSSQQAELATAPGTDPDSEGHLQTATGLPRHTSEQTIRALLDENELLRQNLDRQTAAKRVAAEAMARLGSAGEQTGRNHPTRNTGGAEAPGKDDVIAQIVHLTGKEVASLRKVNATLKERLQELVGQQEEYGNWGTPVRNHVISPSTANVSVSGVAQMEQERREHRPSRTAPHFVNVQLADLLAPSPSPSRPGHHPQQQLQQQGSSPLQKGPIPASVGAGLRLAIAAEKAGRLLHFLEVSSPDVGEEVVAVGRSLQETAAAYRQAAGLPPHIG